MTQVKLTDDQHCFVCGTRNPHGLGITFTICDEQATCVFVPDKRYQGYAGIVHGGIVTLVLDEAMVHLLWRLGRLAVTAQLSVRFRKPALVGEELRFRAWIEQEGPRLALMRGLCENKHGEVVAEAEAKCMKEITR